MLKCLYFINFILLEVLHLFVEPRLRLVDKMVKIVYSSTGQIGVLLKIWPRSLGINRNRRYRVEQKLRQQEEVIGKMYHFIQQKVDEISVVIRETMGEDSQEKMANLLFQLTDYVAKKDVLHVTGALVERFRPDAASGHGGRMPCFSSEVVFVLGAVEGVTYYCQNGELFREHPHQRRNSSVPYIRTVSMNEVIPDLVLGIADEIVGHLNLLLYYRTEPEVHMAEGYTMLKYFISGVCEAEGRWIFELVTAPSPEKAKAVINSWRGYAWQKKLQRMEKIALYDKEEGRWVSLQKNLIPHPSSAHALDIRLEGITETALELVVSQGATQTA